MNTSELLLDAFERVTQTARDAVQGIAVQDLTYRPDPDANTISWLVWHLARVHDDHVADAFGSEQVWTAQGWYERYGLPFDPSETGYGQSTADVGKVAVTEDLLLGYLDAVQEATVGHLRGVIDADLDRVVDTAWDPPVTLGVRLVSVISDGLEHAGQAAYVRGIAERR